MTTQAQTTKDYEKSTMDRLERLESAAPLTMSRQDYERLYLTPKSAVQGDFRKVFGNPTPLYVAKSDGQSLPAELYC